MVKMLLGFLLAAGLVLGPATGSLAAIHDYQGGYYGDFLSTGIGSMIDMGISDVTPGERIFSVEEQGPRFAVVGITGLEGIEVNWARLDYYQNDFVFGDLLYMGVPGVNFTDLRGGYLWEDPGIFVGIDYFTALDDSFYIISGGYRFDLGGDSFAALSLDYYCGEYGGFFELEAHAKYLAGDFKATGQLFVDEDGDYLLRGKANVAVGDDLTLGGGLMWEGGDTYAVFAGLTWEVGNFLFDGLIANDYGRTEYLIGGLYNISESIAFGASYIYQEFSEETITLKGQFDLGQGALTCFYTFPDEGEGAYIGVGYEVSL